MFKIFQTLWKDYTTIKLDFCESQGYHFFAVLDGHVGLFNTGILILFWFLDYRVAEYCSKNLPEFLEAKLGALIKSGWEII